MMLIVVDRKPVYRMHVQFCLIAILFLLGRTCYFQFCDVFDGGCEAFDHAGRGSNDIFLPERQ